MKAWGLLKAGQLYGECTFEFKGHIHLTESLWVLPQVSSIIMIYTIDESTVLYNHMSTLSISERIHCKKLEKDLIGYSIYLTLSFPVKAQLFCSIKES